MAATTIAVAATAYSAYSGAKASRQAGKAAKAQKRSSESQQQIAAEQWQRYLDLYAPLEEQLVKGAAGGVLPQQAADRAGAGVQQAFDRGEEQRGRELARYGVDPSSPRYAALSTNTSLARAAAEAGARTTARRRAKDTNWARRMAAINIGKGMPAQASAGYGAAGAGFGQVAAQYGQTAYDYGRLAVKAPGVIQDFAGQFGGGSPGAVNAPGSANAPSGVDLSGPVNLNTTGGNISYGYN